MNKVGKQQANANRPHEQTIMASKEEFMWIGIATSFLSCRNDYI